MSEFSLLKVFLARVSFPERLLFGQVNWHLGGGWEVREEGRGRDEEERK